MDALIDLAVLLASGLGSLIAGFGPLGGGWGVLHSDGEGQRWWWVSR